PAILFKFKDTPAAQLRTATQYNQVLFAASPTGASAGRPYTYRSYYEQMSNGLFSVQGKSYGYAALDSNEVTYTGVAGTCTGNPYGNTNCNGLFSDQAVARMQGGLREALRKLDNQVDWTQYDFDGDGYVDLVAFIHPPIDGACGGATNNHLWSHRSYLTNAFGSVVPYTTHSVNSQGVPIKVADYILESGVGGLDGCDPSQIMPVGTVVHETGHGFGLPDLYDTHYTGQGVGEWSLMGSGNYSSPLSPSRMDAWSLSQLGWVTIVPLGSAGTHSFGAAPTSDTAFYLPVSGSKPRGEYFLRDNRQAVAADTAMIEHNCPVWYQGPTPPRLLRRWAADLSRGLDADCPTLRRQNREQRADPRPRGDPGGRLRQSRREPVRLWRPDGGVLRLQRRGRPLSWNHGQRDVQPDQRPRCRTERGRVARRPGGRSDHAARAERDCAVPPELSRLGGARDEIGRRDPVRRRHISPVPGCSHARHDAQRERGGYPVHGGRSHAASLRLLVRRAAAQLQLHG